MKNPSFKKKYLPVYKELAPDLLRHYKDYYHAQALTIMQELNQLTKPATYMNQLPLDLKNMVVEVYTESRIYKERMRYENDNGLQ